MAADNSKILLFSYTFSYKISLIWIVHKMQSLTFSEKKTQTVSVIEDVLSNNSE